MKKITLFLIFLALPVLKAYSQTRLETCIQNMLTSFNKADYDNAIVNLDEAISIDPNDYRLWGQRGLCYKYKKDYAKALADLNKTMELSSGDTSAWKNRADVKFNLGDIQGAIGDYSKAIPLTNDGLCVYNRGRCYFIRHDFELAKKDFSKCEELYPKSATIKNLLALTFLTNGTEEWYDTPLSAAYWAFKQAFELDSTLFESRLGMLQYKVRKLDFEGVDNALRALGSDFPKRAEVSYERGLASYLQKDYLTALYQLNKAIIVNPQYAEAYLLRAKAHMAGGSYSTAYDDLNNAISLDSMLWEAWLLRGKIRVKSYFGARAIDDFTHSLECPGPKSEAYRQRAMRKLASNDLIGAEQDYKDAVYCDFGKVDIRVEWGNVLLSMQNVPMAYKVFNDLNRDMDPFPASLCGEAHCLMLQNKNREALVIYDKALKMDENYRPAFVGIGRVKANMKKYNEAIVSFTKAIEMDDLKSDAYYERGCAYLNLKDKEKACSDFSTAQLLGNPQAKEMKAANCN